MTAPALPSATLDAARTLAEDLGHQAEVGADMLLASWAGLRAISEATGSTAAKAGAAHLEEFVKLLLALEICEPCPHPVPAVVAERLGHAVAIATHIAPPTPEPGAHDYVAGIRLGLSRSKLLHRKQQSRRPRRRQ